MSPLKWNFCLVGAERRMWGGKIHTMNNHFTRGWKILLLLLTLLWKQIKHFIAFHGSSKSGCCPQRKAPNWSHWSKSSLLKERTWAREVLLGGEGTCAWVMHLLSCWHCLPHSRATIPWPWRLLVSLMGMEGNWTFYKTLCWMRQKEPLKVSSQLSLCAAKETQFTLGTLRDACACPKGTPTI